MEMSEKWVGREGKENEAHAGLAQLRNTLSSLPRHLPTTVTQHWELPACCSSLHVVAVCTCAVASR